MFPTEEGGGGEYPGDTTDTKSHQDHYVCLSLGWDLIKTPFNTFANRADPDQAALVRAA